MTYRRDLKHAARRHLAAADQLHPHSNVQQCGPQDRPDVAGYLYGIAAECAVKAIMWDGGMRPRGERREDPFFMHFPELKAGLLDRAHGRLQAQLVKIVNDGSLMSEWDVEMRYADSTSVKEKPIDRWKAQARDLVHKMETL